MMNDLLNPLDNTEVRPGDLIRSAPAKLEGEPLLTAVPDLEDEDEDGAEGPRRVLIVDDSDDVRTLLRLKLEGDESCEVVGEAENGLEAIKLATSLQPHLVLLDLAMPQMDGLEALPQIIEAVQGVRVIVLSGFDQNTMAEKALAAGANKYLEKGRAISDLVTVIQGVLAS
jgi:DNA-binding NarL/FixJ family response regulator